MSLRDWRTTDVQEVRRRRRRAEIEKPEIRNLDPRYPVFSNFEVRSVSGRIYTVEIRGLDPRRCSCTCVDFRANGLGTCKHVEAVLLSIPADQLAAARQTESPRIDIVPDVPAGLLRIERGADALPLKWRRRFDSEGYLREEENEEAVLRELADLPEVRISQEVGPWRETRRRELESRLLRREYTRKVQSGEWPPEETLVPLLPYQREGMLHLAFTERALLADEMGLGKTIQAIGASALLHRLGLARRVLVVAPASLKAEWEDQILRFTALPYTIVTGGPAARADSYRAPAFFNIVNYEQVVRDLEEINGLLQPEVVILDEAQRVKNWNTRTAQAVKQLRSRYAFVLTGTPIETRLDDLHSLMDFLRPSVLGPLFRFNREFYEFDADGQPAGCKNLDRLRERVAPYLLRRRRADVETELPGRVDRNHFVPLSAGQRHAYLRLERRAARAAGAAAGRTADRRGMERLLRDLQTMRMLCDREPGAVEGKSCPKLEELERILEECRQTLGTKVAIFSEWEDMLRPVRSLCERLGLSPAYYTGSVSLGRRRAEIHRFRSDEKCRAFLATDVGSAGLNLQSAGVIINCDIPWTAARLEQRVGRVWRKGQANSVSVINLVSEGTIEHRLMGTLDFKKAFAEGVLDLRGNVRQLRLHRGRRALLDRIRALVSPSGRSKRHGADPAMTFAEKLGEAIGEKLVRCEERFPGNQGDPVLVVVLDQQAAAWRDRVKQVFSSVFTEELPGLGVRPRLEVVDRETEDALSRFVVEGLISPTVRASRRLWPREEEASLVRRGAARRRMEDWVLRAGEQLALARRSVAASLQAEARQALLQAIFLLARAFAAARDLEEPREPGEAVSGELAGSWGAAALPVWRFLQKDDTPVLPVVDVVKDVIESFE